jgi:hypothetical protein
MSENEGRRPATVRTNDSPAPPLPETDWAAVYEAQQAGTDDPPPGGFLNNQFAKIGCGCVVPAIFMMGTCSTIAAPGAYGIANPAATLGQLTGGFIGGMALVWAPLFLFWLRDQSKWVIGGSFAFFAAIFVIIGLAGIGSGREAMVDDLANLSEVQYDAEGNPILTPEMAKKGPMSKLMFDMATEQSAIRKEFEADIAKLGISDMMFADRVAKNPALVRDCDRIHAFKSRIEAYRARNMELIKSAPDRIDKIDVNYSVKTEIKRGAMNRMGQNLESINAEWDMQVNALSPIHRTCQTLARRNWVAQGDMYMFNNRGDLNAFQAAMRDIDRINADIAALTSKRMQGVRADQQKLKQEISR